MAMVRAGLGVTVLPKLVCRHADQSIAFREFVDPVPPRRIDLISRARDTPSPATTAFADFIIARIAGEDGDLLAGI